MTMVFQKTRIKKAAATAFILGSSIALQGCVAAAFPLAAGGLLGERTISARDSDVVQPDPRVEVATVETATQGEVANSDLVPVSEQPSTAVPPPSSVSADFNAAFANKPQTNASIATASPASPAPEPIERSVNKVIRPLPTPVPSAREPIDVAPNTSLAAAVTAPVSGPVETPAEAPAFSSSSPLTGQSGINQFLSYANQRQIGSGDDPEAAMLSDRVALEPVKAQCGGVTPTILIDLDPEDALFDSTTSSRPPSGLARGLAQLRASGVSIAWISGNGIDRLDAIKRALRYSGLDLNNEDRVLLIRNADDRKQTLREELSQISCLIAIAGDTRSDFDELYDYLKNPADAQSLEPLIGDGWFLIAQPLL